MVTGDGGLEIEPGLPDGQSVADHPPLQVLEVPVGVAVSLPRGAKHREVLNPSTSASVRNTDNAGWPAIPGERILEILSFAALRFITLLA